MQNRKRETFLAERVYCYMMIMSYSTSCILYESLSAGDEPTSVLEPASVDESFAVSSRLLNLVIVLVNDVKQHSLQTEKKKVNEIQKQTFGGEKCSVSKITERQRVTAGKDRKVRGSNKKREMLRSRAIIVSNSSFHHHLHHVVH